MKKRRLIVGFTGASGAPFAVELLRALYAQPDIESHVIVSSGFMRTLPTEARVTFKELAQFADMLYENTDIGAAPASGTFRTEGMIVAPCSMKTLAGIACGYSDNLLLRAADVTIKERRRLLLAVRETPLSPIHLRNMLALAELGVSIMPPMLSYYNKPVTAEDMTRQFVGRMLDAFDIELSGFKRWNGVEP